MEHLREDITLFMHEAMLKEENLFRNGEINWDFVEHEVYTNIFGSRTLDLDSQYMFEKLFDVISIELREAEIQFVVDTILDVEKGGMKRVTH